MTTNIAEMTQRINALVRRRRIESLARCERLILVVRMERVMSDDPKVETQRDRYDKQTMARLGREVFLLKLLVLNGGSVAAVAERMSLSYVQTMQLKNNAERSLRSLARSLRGLEIDV